MAALRGYKFIGEEKVPVVLPREFDRIMRDAYFIRKGIGTLSEVRNLPARDGQLLFFILTEMDRIEAEKRDKEQEKLKSRSRR